MVALAAGGVVGLAASASVEAFKIPSSSMYPTLEIGDRFYVDKLTYRFRAPRRGEVVVHKYPCAPNTDHVKRVVALAGDTVEVRCNILYVNGNPVPSELVDAQCTYEDFIDEASVGWHQRRCSRYRETLDGTTYEVFHDADRPARDKVGDRGDALDWGGGRDFPTRDHLEPPSCARNRMQTGFLTGGNGEPPPQTLGKVVATKSDAKPCEPQLHYVVPEGHVFGLGDNRSNSNDSRIYGGISIDDLKGRVVGIYLTSSPQSVRFSRIGTVR
jgi:signal peptidase I